MKKVFLALGIVVALLALILLIGIGEEVYRCEILKIPNCD
jgi:hypothetical protein